MSSRREPPTARVQRLDGPPRAENVLDQREITVQSYQSNVAFDLEALEAGVESAWLTPQLRFGVFARRDLGGTDSLHVILGLQDEISVQMYDYDDRRPLWYTWPDVIVETVAIDYFRDQDGLLRFQTTGGGRRITEALLYEFNATFLGIPKSAVDRRQFDLARLRDLCFKRFVARLYMVRFSDPAAKAYKSIDHTQFQSRDYIDPEVERFKEVRSDPQVKIESFDSDIQVRTDDLAADIQVRFSIRGLRGSLRLGFPKIGYKKALQTEEDQVRIFYSLVDATVNTILDGDDDYYTQQRRSLEELEKLTSDIGLFPDMVDLAPYRAVLAGAEARRKFIADVNVGARWAEWRLHLQALDELVLSDELSGNVADLFAERARSDPGQIVRILAACKEDPKTHRVGAVVAGAVAGTLQAISADMRAHVESALLSWALERDDTWDVDADSGEIRVMRLRWNLDHLAVDVFPSVIGKVATVVGARLREGNADTGSLLTKYHWCIEAARRLPPYHSKNSAALRLVAMGRVPRSVAEAARVLKEPVKDLRALDDAVRAQFGLSLWPRLAASRDGDKVVIRNDGVGAALGLAARLSGTLSGDEATPTADLLPGQSISLSLPRSAAAVDVTFDKFGAEHRVALHITGDGGLEAPSNVLKLRATMTAKHLAAARGYRKSIDRKGIIVGSSPALMEVFEHIHHANQIDGAAPVLLLGEPGSGKTHIAKLLHDSSNRSAGPFEKYNAGGGGGDANIQRGEWIGYGKNHGIQGVDRDGRKGHLMKVDGGTLFIDEFADLSGELQSIFLYVLENHAIEKVGGDSFTPNIRCIFATNADIDEAIESGKLRRDLLDRIGVTIRIPALRERQGDILLLAKHFAGSHRVAPRCLFALLRHDWPGNVRELQKTMRAAVAKSKIDGSTTIDLCHVDLPNTVVDAVAALDDSEWREELWRLADEIARSEGFEQGGGLQRRAGEIIGVEQAQASKMYRALGFARGKAGRRATGTV